MNDTTYGFNFLIDKQPSLPTRLWRELYCQAHEFRDDPSGYIKGSFANDTIGRKRARLLFFGVAVGVIFLSAALGTTILFYYSKAHLSAANAGNDKGKFNLVPLIYPDQIRVQTPKKGNDSPRGGGSGGNGELLPASYGVTPPGSDTPPIVAPTAHESPIKNPDLPVMTTVLVHPDLIPPQPKDLPFGVTNGQHNALSDGPGSGQELDPVLVVE